jgi:P2X purinoceptor 1
VSAVSPSPALLREAENFTLFIKNSISFPRFKVNRFVGNTSTNVGGSWLLELISALALSLHSCCSCFEGRSLGCIPGMGY